MNYARFQNPVTYNFRSTNVITAHYINIYIYFLSTCKVSEVLNFLEQFLHKCSTSTKITAYIYIYTQLYINPIWDMLAQYGIHIINNNLFGYMIESSAQLEQLTGHYEIMIARIKTCRYSYSNVTLMQHHLSWNNVQQCQQITKVFTISYMLHFIRLNLHVAEVFKLLAK